MSTSKQTKQANQNTQCNVFEVAQRQAFDELKARLYLVIDDQYKATFKRLNTTQLTNYDFVNFSCVFDTNGEVFDSVEVCVKRSDIEAINRNYNLLNECAECGALHLFGLDVAIVDKNGQKIGTIQADHKCDYYEIEDGSDVFLCDDCADLYDKCDYCGRLLYGSDGTRVYDDYGNEVYYCEDCLDEHAWKCDCCGNYYTYDVDNYEVDGDTICEDCKNEYTSCCAECGDRHYERNMHYDEDEGEFYCDDCYEDIQRNGNVIEDYHTSHHETRWFHNTNGISTTEAYSDVVYVGTESETSHARNTLECERIARLIRDIDTQKQHFFIEHDGSLDYGFEIISQPFTIDGLNDDVCHIMEALKIASDNGMKAHDTTDCGLHIHFTRCILGSTEKKQYNTLLRLVDFFDQFKNDLIAFNRREFTHYCEAYYINVNNYDTRREAIRDAVPSLRGDDRYYAINTTNAKTIEIRAPKGTLNTTTYCATIRFYYDLICACRDLSSVEFYDGETIRLDNVLDNQKQNAIDYMKQRNCFAGFVARREAQNEAQQSASKLCDAILEATI